LLDAVAAFKPDPDFRQHHQLSDKKIIALLPGSRRQEISRLLPEMIAAAKKWPDYAFIVAGAPSFELAYYDQYLNNTGIKVLFNATYDLLYIAQAAIVASGTATLETALFSVPQIVVYKGNPVSITIARALVKIRFISLVNLIMDDNVVKELIQQDCNPQKINEEMALILDNKIHRIEMANNYKILKEKMGKPGASEKTAGLIIHYISKK
jgi:lipid-A-disaccharide synthase